MLEVIERGSRNGSGPSLLFVHGTWHAAWCWDEHFLDFFASKGHHALAVSLRGHGGSPSPKPLRWVTIADYVDDVAAVANELPSRPVVIGHSMGGFIVQKYLESHSAPAGVLLGSAPSGGIWRSTLRTLRRHPRALLAETLTLSPYRLVGTLELARDHMFSAQMPEADVERYFALLQEDSHRAMLDMLVLNLPKPKRVTAPMLVLGADQDHAFSRKEVRATARAYGTEAEIFPNMAHHMLLEPGWERVAERIDGWLRQLQSGAPKSPE
ncbi:alpha/beta hydrolase fold protein [Rhodococcus opacus M213]|uniref:Alpha/beta hydrolase fold protein n=1 Tax=Rhodococcus opacus M213 TaxID=1129896 RepID=K8XTI6_RHOOP|nr:alpha/beta hydrolase [Rhodococcus opacus]EKT81447.1 alpha/beta hydrolase fold protein [Rhodococcus opacus M213]